MAEQTTHTLPLREEVPAKDKWHIEDIFSNDDAFTSALEACRTHIDALPAPPDPPFPIASDPHTEFSHRRSTRQKAAPPSLACGYNC